MTKDDGVPTDEAACRDLPSLLRGVSSGACAFEALVERLLPAIAGTERLDPPTLLELSTALNEFERHAVRDDRLYALVNDEGAAAVALGESGQILTMNAAATAAFGAATGDGLEALRIKPSEYDELKARLARCAGPSLIRAAAAGAGSRSAPLILSASYHPPFKAVVLTELLGSWPQAVDLALRELFALSPGECEVLSRLARGEGSAEIARMRGSSVGTVRQQIKAVTAKLGRGGQLAAATLAAAAAASGSAADRATAASTGKPPLAGQESPLTMLSLLRDGRRVGYRRFGDAGGRPVVFLHGPSFGAGEYREDRRLAERRGLSVFAIERPGYGRTDPAPSGEDPRLCEYRDLMALAAREKLGPAFVLAHEAALIPALNLAGLEPAFVRGVLAVSSSPPFLELEQISALPASQGVYIHAARQADWMSRLLIKILTVRMRRLGPQRWTDVIFDGQDFDKTVLSRPGLSAGVVATYSFYLNQMGAGFEHDLRVMLADWSEELRLVKAPLYLTHGARNTTTPVKYLEIFKRLRPEVSIELVPDAGLSLAVSHPQLIYRKLASLARA